MKKLKSTDFFLQFFLLLITVIAFVIGDYEKVNPAYFLFGFALVQVISIFANSMAGQQSWKMKKWRKIHIIGMLLVFLLLFIALLQDSSGRNGDKDDKYSMAGLGTALIALIPAIAAAVFYLLITWKEWLNIKKEN